MISRLKKPIRRVPGDLLKIPLGKDHHGYARVLEGASEAFYDVLADHDISFEELKVRPILFVIPVMSRAITSGRWPIVGNFPLEERFRVTPKFFKQDRLDPNNLTIYYEECGIPHEIPASRSQCEGLERAAVWDPEHVEDRLRDHFAGRPNKWVRALQIRGAD